MQTIAQQLKITKFPFQINDDEGNQIYCENSNGYWSKQEYDEKGNCIYHENSVGFWRKQEFDEKGNLIYYENSVGKVIDKRRIVNRIMKVLCGLNIKYLTKTDNI